MDKAARALQLAGCIAHTGDAFVFAPGGELPVVNWKANTALAAAAGTPPLNPLIPPQAIRLVGARAPFAAPSREPIEGDHLTDAVGNAYRVHAKDEDITNPLLTLYVTTSKA